MKYIFLMKINVPGFQSFITYGKDFELDNPINKDDEIHINEFMCEINEIWHEINENKTFIKMTVIDPLFICGDEKEVIECLEGEEKEMLEDGWYIDDYELGKEKE